jgi:hypothetical protein
MAVIEVGSKPESSNTLVIEVENRPGSFDTAVIEVGNKPAYPQRVDSDALPFRE